jgi:hypothetical protein
VSSINSWVLARVIVIVVMETPVMVLTVVVAAVVAVIVESYRSIRVDTKEALWVL